MLIDEIILIRYCMYMYKKHDFHSQSNNLGYNSWSLKSTILWLNWGKIGNFKVCFMPTIIQKIDMATVVICYLHSNQALCHTCCISIIYFVKSKSLRWFNSKECSLIGIYLFLCIVLFSLDNLAQIIKAPFRYFSVLSILKPLFSRFEHF